MKRFVWWSVGALLTALPVTALDVRDDKEDVKSAAKKLAEQSNYSFASTTKSEGGGGGNRPQGGSLEGKTEKDGYTVVTSKRGDTTQEGVRKGDKAAVKTADGWKSADEFVQGGGGGQRDPAAGFARALKSIKLPSDDAESLADKVKEFKKNEDGSYSGDLTEEGAKELLTRGGRGGGGGGQNAPAVTDPKGSAKFWVKDGVLVKYEVNVQGKMMGRNQTEIAINRTTTVEIKDMGSTKVEVPEEAKKKLE